MSASALSIGSTTTGWMDIALSGALAEEIAEAEREKERIRKEMEKD